MKTIEMEIALMSYFGIRQNIIVPNISWSFLYNHEADLIVLTGSSYATEIEIKVSKADLKKDKEKKHCHESDMIKYLDFAVPVKLKEFALTEIPKHAGLITVELYENYNCYTVNYAGYRVERIRPAMKNKHCKAWSCGERQRLSELGCMRILGLKKKVFKLSNKAAI